MKAVGKACASDRSIVFCTHTLIVPDDRDITCESEIICHLPISKLPPEGTVEPEFWEQFPLMTMERQTTIGKLLAEIDRTGRLLLHQGPGRHRVRTLSAAVRVFVLQTLISRSSSGARRTTITIAKSWQFSRSGFSKVRKKWRGVGPLPACAPH